jgi:hypothetical protein
MGVSWGAGAAVLAAHRVSGMGDYGNYLRRLESGEVVSGNGRLLATAVA